jgi:biopolymer transport protein ExbB/TolQ
VILAHLNHLVSHPAALGFLFQDDQSVGFSPIDLWNHMGYLAKGVVFVLFVMSIWSLAVIIDRWLYFSAARKQSREFAPRVAGALKEGKLDEAVKVADRNKKSHLAEVVTAGLQ